MIVNFRSVLPSSVFRETERWLVLHGWGQGAVFWQPVARHLAQSGITLFCPDMPALAAMSPAPQGSAERLQQVVEQLTVAALASDITTILAHSAGAPAGVLLAERINLELVLIEPLLHQLGLSSQSKVNRLRRTEQSGTVMDQLNQQYPFAQLGILETIAAALRDELPQLQLNLNTSASSRGELVLASLEKLRKTVLIIRGGRSAMLSKEETDIILAAIPKAKTVVIPHAGHSAHVDTPNQLFQILMEM